MIKRWSQLHYLWWKHLHFNNCVGGFIILIRWVDVTCGSCVGDSTFSLRYGAMIRMFILNPDIHGLILNYNVFVDFFFKWESIPWEVGRWGSSHSHQTWFTSSTRKDNGGATNVAILYFLWEVALPDLPLFNG